MKSWSVLLVSALAVLPATLSPSPATAVTLAEGTPVQVRLLQDLKSGHARKGEQVRFEVVSDVVGPDRSILVPKGTPAVGTVTRSTGRKMFGKPGKLEFTIEYIRLPDDTRIPLRSTPTAAQGRNNSGVAIATAVLLAPIALLVKGREVTVRTGREFGVFVDKSLDLARSNASGRPEVETVALHVPKNASAQLSEVKLKSGLILTGTIIGFKDGAYILQTEAGQMTIPQERVESITQPKVPTANAQE